jgi:hypothetical protein
MSKLIEKLNKYTGDNDINEMRDEENPEYLFNGVFTSLLVKIVNKKIDPVKLAEKALCQRGLDKNGKWIQGGPEKAKNYWKIK